MAGEWRPSTWGEEITLAYGKALRGHDKAIGQYRVYGSNGPIGWTTEPLSPGPGVVLGRKGAYRGVEYSSDPFFVIDTAYYVVPRNPDLDMRWLYYAIKHYKLGEIDDGSPIPSTTRAAVYVRELQVPPVAEQRAIGHVLGALDDKIELNRRMSVTLDALTQALFRSWFVDFDPVRAKAEGRSTGLPAEIDDLFSDQIVESPIGPIPEGWEAAPLSTIATLVQASVHPAREPGRVWHHFSIPAFDAGRVPALEPGADIKSGKYAVPATAVLVSKLNPATPRVWLPDVTSEEDAICSTEFLPFVPNQLAQRSFLFELIRSERFGDAVATRASGSTGSRQRVLPRDVAAIVCPIPPEALLNYFSEIIRPSHLRVLQATRESSTLAGVRDALHPRLVSGELRVPDVDRVLERAAS